jgi:spore coat polysaccharide biosynthesis protein SpsF
VVVVQARMSSTRLPGKVLSPLAGAPALVRMMERVRRATRVSCHLVATSDHVSDDAIADVCGRHGIRCTRGPLDDVLARIAGAVPSDCEVVVRLTADCPLTDPHLIDRHLERFSDERPWVEYVTNAVVRTFPDGLDVEALARTVLMEADCKATSPFDREHVTPWIQRHARTVAVTQEVNLASLRWVLDTADDYLAISAVYEILYAANPGFSSRDIVELLVGRPDLIRTDGAVQPGEMRKRLREWLSVEVDA